MRCGRGPRIVHTDAASSSPIARSCLSRGRDESSCGSGHSPATPWPHGVGGLQKKHRTNYVESPCAGRSCCDCCSVFGCCLRSTGSWEMASGNMFPPWTAAFEIISRDFYMKVDSDLQVNSRPALCARPVVFNAPDNLEILNFADQFTSRICTLSVYQRDVPVERGTSC